MNKVGKILLGIILLAMAFAASAFGMYKYAELRSFNNLVNEGNQYLLQKEYDKAIQSFQQALNYKNNADIKNNLALAQNLKSENNNKDTISKNIQLANNAAKNSKYDAASKYLDEVLKLDPNNSEANNLKDSYAKAVQAQQEKATAKTESEEQQSRTTSSTNTNIKQSSSVSYNQALAIVQKEYPGCSFQPAEQVLSKDVLNKAIPYQARIGNYIFYGHDNIHSFDLQDLVLVSKLTGRICTVSPNGSVVNKNE